MANARRVLGHALSCLAARGGRLHPLDDAQAEPRGPDVRRRTTGFVGRRAAGLPIGPGWRLDRRGLLDPPGRAIVDRLGTASAIRAAALGGDAIAGPSASRHTKQ